MKPPPARDDLKPPERRTNWTTISLVAALFLLVGLVVYELTSGNPNQDKLTNTTVATSTRPPARDKLCASSATYDLIKRELFRRAAQLRGSDQAAFDKLSGYAVLRMENPVMESQDSSIGAVNCSGALSLDLPPGVAVVGGRGTLSSEVDYTVTSAADGSGPVVLLRSADPIIAPLATMARVATNPPGAVAEGNAVTAPVAPAVPIPAPPAPVTVHRAEPPAQTAPPPVTPPALPQPRNMSARASFDCSRARTHGELAICGDAGLAALDRQMAAEYSRAHRAASPEQRAILLDTAHRFYAYRDRCPTNACIANAYAGRMREIRDIIEGSWQPAR
jgi:uncharacterized protein YecT (DUF1311 family)